MGYSSEARSRGLLDCPTEIFNEIFGLDTSPADLASLCRTNKSVSILTEPLLYAKVEWEWLEADHPPPITLLLRTLLHRPDLATHVESLILRGETFIFSCKKRKSPPLPSRPGLSDHEIENAIRKTTASEANTGLADQWISAARAGSMDAFVALLLVRLPRLARLVLETNFARDMDLVGRAVLCETTRSSGASFRRLRSVDIFAREDWDATPTSIDNTEAALAMFYLPSVQHIRATVGSPKGAFGWPAQAPDPSTLTSLELFDIREPHLGELLKVTPCLRRLSWTWYKNPDMHHTSHIVDLDAISAALECVGETLTELDISADTDEGCGVDFPRLEFQGALDGLRKLRYLERLRIPLIFLMGSASAGLDARRRRLEDVVPSTLRHVTLTHELGMNDCFVNGDHSWDDGDQFDKIASWLQASKVATPHLRSMDFEFGIWAPSGWNASMRDSLRRLGAEMGIKVECTYLSGSR